MNRMDLNSTHSCDFSYHNITRSQISIDKYNGESKRINILEKISGQEVVEERTFLEFIKNDCIFRKNCASVPEERSAIPLQTEQSSAG